jgi:GrpB-like predicted nucleotidyltransferase (UPF0157 family)
MRNAAPIVLVPYDPSWPDTFAALRAVLAGSLGPVALAIEHVGSTAVPGLAAKPILDIDVVIESNEQLPDAVRRLGGLGYDYQGDLGIAGREAFGRSGDDVPRDGSGRLWPAHHLYVCPLGSAELARHLAFRDYLRADPAAAQAYGDLKHDLAQRFGSDRDGYSRAKTAFVEQALQRATASGATRTQVMMRARRLFPAVALTDVLAVVDNYGAEPYQREKERVQMAALKIAGGNLARLREAMALARTDYRDVLATAEYPNELRAGFTEDVLARARIKDAQQYRAWLDGEDATT